MIQKEQNNDAYALQGHAVKANHLTNHLAAAHMQRAESRGSEYRPRIGRKQIEIAPPGAQTNFAATMNTNQLKIAKQGLVPAVLAEINENCLSDKESPSSAPSTHRTPDKINDVYKFGRLLGEGASAVVRLVYNKNKG